MSKVRSIHVVLIVVVVGILALYVGGVGAGLDRDRKDTKSTIDTWRARIESWQGTPEPVRADELRWQGGQKILPQERRFAGTATLHIKPSDDGRRALTVRTREAMKLIIRRSTMPDAPMTLQTDADKDNEVDIRVHGQAAIEMTCKTNPCTVRLE